ncbi:MAG TPA: hypothetical protein VHX64_06980 [Caulobacteraceae bacterium]|jgi:hypothetical protein|nr:hypothetical protein [Caulobacteraceae bacterium]
MKVIVLAAILALGGCASIPLTVTVKPTCLPMADYSPESQATVSAERTKLADDDLLNVYLTDYGKLRAANRAVCPSPPPATAAH